MPQDVYSGINERTRAFVYRTAGLRIASGHRFTVTGVLDFQRWRCVLAKLSSRLVREGEIIFGTAIDAYGRILKDLERVFTTPERRARMGTDLKIVGDATALVRELLDQLETLRPTCDPSRGGLRRPIPEAANDDDDLPD